MKRLLNLLGYLVSDLTQNELAARGACRCHGMADQARNHRESGYHSLVALVLAMQADAFVITSGSNWSRLMEELCLGKDLEPRCPTTTTRSGPSIGSGLACGATLLS